MGCAPSRESSGPNRHRSPKHHHRHHYPSSSHYDWAKEEGGYIPYRSQAEHRRRWHQEDKNAYAQQVRDAAERERNRRALEHYNANDKKACIRRRYKGKVGRKWAEAFGQQVKDEAERDRHRGAVGCRDVHEKRGNMRGAHAEEGRRKEAAGRTEEIRVYASPDLKLRRSGQ